MKVPKVQVPYIICFDCGRVGHRKESCNSKIGPINHTAGENPTVASPEPSAAKAVSFNGNPVPEKTEEIGYGEWMVVNRRKTKKNGPIGNGPQGLKQVQAQNGKGPAQSVIMNKNKAPTSSGLQYKPKENHKDQASVQQEKREGSSKQASNGNAQKKSDHQPGFRYEFNPLLRKQNNNTHDTVMKDVGGSPQKKDQPTKPTYSPIVGMEIVLDIPNPNTSSNIQLPPTENANPHSIPKKNTQQKKPPDILTYHEFARNSEGGGELPQGEHVDRTRERSCSPSKRSLVARGTAIQDQAIQDTSGRNVQPHGNTQTDDPPGLGQEQDPQTLRST